MDPLKILYEEHRTIQRVIKFLEKLKENLRQSKSIIFDKIIDFFRFYADKCHHGKEENILFSKLEEKKLLKEEKQLLQELIEEHKMARYLISEVEKLKEITNEQKLSTLLDKIIILYKQHIDKENKILFPSSLKYFSEKEKNQLLNEFNESDRRIIHEKYKQMIDELEVFI